MKVLIGKIIKPQGLNGEMKIYPNDDNLSIYKKVNAIYLGENSTLVPVKKLSARQGYLYLTLASVKDRDEAEKYRNVFVYVEEEQLVLQNDMYLSDYIVGAEVVTTEGEYVGEVLEIENFGASDVFTILEDGRQYMVPFITSIFVKIEKDMLVINKERYDEVKICE